MKHKKIKAVRAWMVCAYLNGGITPVFPDVEGNIKGFPTVYKTKEEAVKQWGGWGFMATVVQVEIRIIK